MTVEIILRSIPEGVTALPPPLGWVHAISYQVKAKAPISTVSSKLKKKHNFIIYMDYHVNGKQCVFCKLVAVSTLFLKFGK